MYADLPVYLGRRAGELFGGGSGLDTLPSGIFDGSSCCDEGACRGSRHSRRRPRRG